MADEKNIERDYFSAYSSFSKKYGKGAANMSEEMMDALSRMMGEVYDFAYHRGMDECQKLIKGVHKDMITEALTKNPRMKLSTYAKNYYGIELKEEQKN